eukprot:163137_1
MSHLEDSEQTEEINSPTQDSRQCKTCAFYSNPECCGYCSVCFQKYLGEKQPDVEEAKSPEVKVDESVVVEEPVAKKQKIQKKKNRCFLADCRRKIPFASRFECRCSYIFCGNHRSPLDHNCTFDYQSEQERLIASENPEVVAQKVQQI